MPPVSFQTSQLSMVPKAMSPASARSRRLRPEASGGVWSEQPGDLGGGKVGVDDQTGALADESFAAGRLQLLADGRRAAVLPDDGVAYRAAGLAVPHDGGFTLVGDADGGELASPTRVP